MYKNYHIDDQDMKNTTKTFQLGEEQFVAYLIHHETNNK